MEDYAATHRLTRSQKTLVQQMMKEKGLPLTDIDPMTLLDKDTFTGKFKTYNFNNDYFSH